MNEFKGTPGPWIFWDNGSQVGVGKAYDNESDIAHVDGFDSDRSLAEEAANARLIAAAPDLLSALERMIKWGQAQKTAEGSGYWSLRQARDAMEKALGEKP